MTKPRQSPAPQFAPGRALVELLYGNSSTMEGRRAFVRHCNRLNTESWDGSGAEQKAATDDLVKLFLFFENRNELDRFRELSPGAHFRCENLRSTQPARFEAAKAARKGRPKEGHGHMLFCLWIEHELENGVEIKSAIEIAREKAKDRQGRIKNKEARDRKLGDSVFPLGSDTARKYYERFKAGRLFPADEIAASRALVFGNRESISKEEIDAWFAKWFRYDNANS